MAEQKYVVMKAEAIEDILKAGIKALLKGDMAAEDAYQKCLNIISRYQVDAKDVIVGKEDING